jgi:hypothetical protein
VGGGGGGATDSGEVVVAIEFGGGGGWPVEDITLIESGPEEGGVCVVVGDTILKMLYLYFKRGEKFKTRCAEGRGLRKKIIVAEQTCTCVVVAVG